MRSQRRQYYETPHWQIVRADGTVEPGKYSWWTAKHEAAKIGGTVQPSRKKESF